MPFMAAIFCDKCDAQFVYVHTTKTRLIKRGKENGWKISRKEHEDICLCPKYKED